MEGSRAQAGVRIRSGSHRNQSEIEADLFVKGRYRFAPPGRAVPVDIEQGRFPGRARVFSQPEAGRSAVGGEAVLFPRSACCSASRNGSISLSPTAGFVEVFQDVRVRQSGRAVSGRGARFRPGEDRRWECSASSSGTPHRSGRKVRRCRQRRKALALPAV